MASRKTRKQKEELRRRREAQAKVESLYHEREEIFNKKSELKKELKKERNIKNLNIFKTTFKLLYPYCLLALGVQIPALVFHGGFPFVIDSHTYYKEKTLDVSYEGEIDYQERYVTNYWEDDRNYPNELTITSPWLELDEETIIRTIREYEVTYTDELEAMIMSQNYEELDAILGSPDVEIQERSNDTLKKDNDYHVEGSLGTIDENSSFKLPEDETTNTIITSFDLSLFILLYLFIIKVRKFAYLDKVKKLQEEYNLKKAKYNFDCEFFDNKLKRVDEEILKLKR